MNIIGCTVSIADVHSCCLSSNLQIMEGRKIAPLPCVWHLQYIPKRCDEVGNWTPNHQEVGGSEIGSNEWG